MISSSQHPEVIDGPRACTREELPEVLATTDSVFIPDSNDSMLPNYPLAYRDGNLENLRILKVGKELASVVPYVPRTVATEGCQFSIGIIAPTATAPQHRKKGYALRCVRDCIAKMEREKRDLSVLWTLTATFPFYQNAQYQAVGIQSTIYRPEKRDADRFADHGEEIVTYDPKKKTWLPEMLKMREREDSGLRRSEEEGAMLFNIPKMNVFVALRKGLPVAYLVNSASRKSGLLEAFGEPSAIETLIHRALAKLEKEEDFLRAYTEPCSTHFGDLLKRKVPERGELCPPNRMVRINNAPAFFHKISSWLEKRNAGEKRAFSIGVEGEVISFEFSTSGLELGERKCDEHFEFSRRELVSVVFGPHPTQPMEMPALPSPLRGLFPLPFPIWMLDRN